MSSRPYDQRLRNFHAAYGTAQTNTVMVAAPGVGNKIAVKQILFTSSAVQILTIKSSTTTNKLIAYTPVNGGINPREDSGEYLFECADNESLTITTTGVTSSINLVYGIVGVNP